MLAYGFPALFALFVWWFSTGVVLYVVGLPRRTHLVSMAVATIVAAVALYVLWSWSDTATVPGAYAAFSAALAVWGWHEMSFLTGLVTGPRVTECPGRSGDPKPQRAPLWPAVEAVLYHEFAIALTAAGIAIMTWGADNLVGLWTFVILWLMRLSAKLNIYFGVRNLTEHFLPAHLQYLKSYFCRKPMNLFFPLSVTVSTIVAALLWAAALARGVSAFEAAGFTFLGTLMALAVLEHWFLVVPISADQLWTWGLASRSKDAKADDVASDPVRIAVA